MFRKQKSGKEMRERGWGFGTGEGGMEREGWRERCGERGVEREAGREAGRWRSKGVKQYGDRQNKAKQ